MAAARTFLRSREAETGKMPITCISVSAASTITSTYVIARAWKGR